MYEKKKYNYRSLINHHVAVASCFFSLLQLLLSVFILICGFTLLSGFCDDLVCQGITDALGLWIGFPLLVPALVGVVVLGTRHRMTIMFYILSNFIVLVFSIVHVIMSHEDNSDYWKPQQDMYKDGKCSINGFNGCKCTGASYEKYPYRCDLIEFGYNLNWILFGLGIASITLTVCGAATGIIGWAIRRTVSTRTTDRNSHPEVFYKKGVL